jgi:hypothetical protein
MPRHASRDGGDIQANSVRDLVGWNEDCAGNTQDHTNPRTIHTLDPVPATWYIRSKKYTDDDHYTIFSSFSISLALFSRQLFPSLFSNG